MRNSSTIGVVAVQGAFDAHCKKFEQLGHRVREVRVPSELAEIDGLVLPGGESTTIAKLLDSSGLRKPLSAWIEAQRPIFGTCAGAIMLACEITNPATRQWSFGAIDITVERNGYGRQLNSTEADVQMLGDSEPFDGFFIRAPRVVRCGPHVEVLGTYLSDPVWCRHRNVVVTTFHPELTTDLRIHETFSTQVNAFAEVH